MMGGSRLFMVVAQGMLYDLLQGPPVVTLLIDHLCLSLHFSLSPNPQFILFLNYLHIFFYINYSISNTILFFLFF